MNSISFEKNDYRVIDAAGTGERMFCSFVRVDKQLVRCAFCGQLLASPNSPDQIRARCRVGHSSLIGHIPVKVSEHEDLNGRPLRIVMFTPSLQLGGAELWVRTMVTELDPARIIVQGVVIAHSHTQINEKLLFPIAARTRVTAPRPDPVQPEFSGIIERFSSRQEAAAEVLRGADIVVCWAIGGVLHEMLSDFEGHVVAVSHGVCRWTKADMLRQQVGGGHSHRCR